MFRLACFPYGERPCGNLADSWNCAGGTPTQIPLDGFRTHEHRRTQTANRVPTASCGLRKAMMDSYCHPQGKTLTCKCGAMQPASEHNRASRDALLCSPIAEDFRIYGVAQAGNLSGAAAQSNRRNGGARQVNQPCRLRGDDGSRALSSIWHGPYDSPRRAWRVHVHSTDRCAARCAPPRSNRRHRLRHQEGANR